MQFTSQAPLSHIRAISLPLIITSLVTRSDLWKVSLRLSIGLWLSLSLSRAAGVVVICLDGASYGRTGLRVTLVGVVVAGIGALVVACLVYARFGLALGCGAAGGTGDEGAGCVAAVVAGVLFVLVRLFEMGKGEEVGGGKGCKGGREEKAYVCWWASVGGWSSCDRAGEDGDGAEEDGLDMHLDCWMKVWIRMKS